MMPGESHTSHEDTSVAALDGGPRSRRNAQANPPVTHPRSARKASGMLGLREPLNKGATPPRNSPISEGTLNLKASKLDLISDFLTARFAK